MNKTELIAAVAEKAEISKKDAEKAVKAFTDVVSEELVNGGKIQLVGFGTFEVSERPAREGRNPRTGETMTIAAKSLPGFLWFPWSQAASCFPVHSPDPPDPGTGHEAIKWRVCQRSLAVPAGNG